MGNKIKWTKEMVDELRELIEQKKYTRRQATEKMGLRSEQVKGATMRFQIKGAQHHRAWSKENVARMKELLIAGCGYQEVADILSKELKEKINYHLISSGVSRFKLAKKFLPKDTKIATYQALTLPMDNYIISCDYHSPYHSEIWINRSLAIADKFKIKKHVIIGDLFDFNALKYFVVDDGGPKRNLDEEIAQTDPVIRALDYFDKNILVCGNHERRVGMKTDSIIQARHLFGLYGEGIWNRKFKYSVYDKLFIGNDWMVVHPRSYSQISTSVARRMAEKYHRNILSAHGHFVGMAYDRSGKFLAIDLGGMFDTKKIDYINLQTTTHPNWKNGFGVLYNKKFYFFTDETDWNFWLK